MTIEKKDIIKLKKLISTGNRIHLGFLIEYGFFNWVENIHDVIREKKPLSFRFTYEDWYSKALVVLETFQPDFLDEFIQLYRNKNQAVSVSPPYTIFDFLVGNEIRRSHDYSIKVAAVKQNLERQLEILETISKC
jgi:hypothetical protein